MPLKKAFAFGPAELRRLLVPLGLSLCVGGLPARAQEAVPSPTPPASSAPFEPPAAVNEPGQPALPAAGARQRRTDDDSDARPSLPVSVGARLIAGFEHESERPAGAQTQPAQKEYGFTIRQVRLFVRGEMADLFRVNVSFDLADALSSRATGTGDQPPYLRTATIQYRPSREFRLQVGRFKRPFSHLELVSASDLPILGRGLFNDLAIEDNQWGDRAVGMMASGRLKQPKLRWYLSLTNPSGRSALPTSGLDVIGRVEWTIVKDLVLGANAAYKNIEIGDDRLNEFGYGGDVTFELGDAHFLVEGSDVALPFETGRPRGRGVLFLFDYELELDADFSLQPTFFAEYADADTEVSQNESMRLAAGVNLLAYSGFRIMPQVDVVRSIGDTSAANPWLESETLSLIFSLVL